MEQILGKKILLRSLSKKNTPEPILAGERITVKLNGDIFELIFY